MIVAAIQARTGSRRLPGKVLADLAGKPVLARVIERVLRARAPDAVIVATSTAAHDDAIAVLCGDMGVPCFRGSESDVLDRMYCAIAPFRPEAMIRVTADCPLLDPGVLDQVVDLYHATAVDYASNINPPTFPHGLDVEICRFDVLQAVWGATAEAAHREHVTLYVRERPKQFRMRNLVHAPDLSNCRWVLDLPQDLDFLRAVYAHLGEATFGMDEVLSVLAQHPELAAQGSSPRERQVSSIG